MREDRERTCAGSFTVEASMLMSIILMLMFLLIQLNLFQTDVVRITALMAEDSTYTKAEESERNAWMTKSGKGFFYLNASGIGRTVGSSRVQETYTSAPVSLVWGKQMTVKRSFTRTVRDPVKFLWMVEAICDGNG